LLWASKIQNCEFLIISSPSLMAIPMCIYRYMNLMESHGRHVNQRGLHTLWIKARIERFKDLGFRTLGCLFI
jgi:hypothetical protein